LFFAAGFAFLQWLELGRTDKNIERQANLIGEQLNVMQAQAKAAKDSADATRDAVRLAEKTAERQLRAYLSVVRSEVRNFGFGNKVQVHIVFKNTGQTPAYEVASFDAISLLDFPGGIFDIDPIIDTALPGTVIGANGEYHITRTFDSTLTQTHIDALTSGRFAIYSFGRVKYRDAFGVQRKTNFRVAYGGDRGLNVNFIMSPLPEGNEAD
jgi:hypothetical protein